MLLLSVVWFFGWLVDVNRCTPCLCIVGEKLTGTGQAGVWPRANIMSVSCVTLRVGEVHRFWFDSGSVLNCHRQSEFYGLVGID